MARAPHQMIRQNAAVAADPEPQNRAALFATPARRVGINLVALQPGAERDAVFRADLRRRTSRGATAAEGGTAAICVVAGAPVGAAAGGGAVCRVTVGLAYDRGGGLRAALADGAGTEAVAGMCGFAGLICDGRPLRSRCRACAEPVRARSRALPAFAIARPVSAQVEAAVSPAVSEPAPPPGVPRAEAGSAGIEGSGCHYRLGGRSDWRYRSCLTRTAEVARSPPTARRRRRRALLGVVWSDDGLGSIKISGIVCGAGWSRIAGGLVPSHANTASAAEWAANDNANDSRKIVTPPIQALPMPRPVAFSSLAPIILSRATKTTRASIHCIQISVRAARGVATWAIGCEP